MWWSLCHSNGAWGSFQLSKSCFCASLGVVSRALSGGVTRVYRGGLVGLRWIFFLFSLFSLSFPRNSRLTFQKIIVIQFVILSILASFWLLFIWLLMLFEVFFSNFITGYFIQFDFFSDLVTLLLIALFLCFILFLIIIYLQFSPFWF